MPQICLTAKTQWQSLEEFRFLTIKSITRTMLHSKMQVNERKGSLWLIAFPKGAWGHSLVVARSFSFSLSLSLSHAFLSFFNAGYLSWRPLLVWEGRSQWKARQGSRLHESWQFSISPCCHPVDVYPQLGRNAVMSLSETVWRENHHPCNPRSVCVCVSPILANVQVYKAPAHQVPCLSSWNQDVSVRTLFLHSVPKKSAPVMVFLSLSLIQDG